MRDVSEDEQEAEFIHRTAVEARSDRKSKAKREEQLRKMMEQEGVYPISPNHSARANLP